MATENEMSKMIGMYDCLQKQLYYQIERIEQLELQVIEIVRRLE